MAKRKVNTKLLVVLTAAVIGVGGGAIGYHKFHHESPEKYTKMADSLMEQGSYEKAARTYGAAFGASKFKDLDLMMKQAEAWHRLAETDPVYERPMVDCWAKILEYDSSYEPALRKLVEFWDKQINMMSPEQRGTYYSKLKDYASRLAAVAPQDKAVAAKVPAAVVQGWMVGVATPPKDVDDALAQLAKLRAQDPSNAEIPTVIAQAQLKRRDEAAQRQDLPGVEKALAAATGVFDEALKGQDQNVLMHARAAAMYGFVAQYYKHMPKKEQEATRLADLSKAQAQQVLKLAKPAADQSQAQAVQSAAMVLAQSGDAAGAEAAMKSVADARPNDASARLAYARILAGSPAGQQKAIEILAQPFPAQGVSPAQQRRDDAERLFQLIELRLDQLRDVKDTAEKDATLKAVDADLTTLVKYSGENNPAYLRLRGQYLISRGQETDAVQTLARARSLLQQQGRTDDQLTYSLATAYLRTRQNGEARKLLGDVLAHRPEFVPARRLMAQMALQENDPDAAEPHVRVLEKVQPGDPDVTRQRIAILMLRHQPDQAKKLYDSLPEGDRLTRIGKGQVALGIGNFDEAVRLLEPVFKEDPKNGSIARLLVAAHRGRNDLTAARNVLDQAVNANPADVSLAAARKQMSGATGEEMVQFTKETAEKTTDPYLREMRLAGLAGEEGKPTEALDHLKRAEQIKPEDRGVLDALFQAYASDAKWDLAAQYADKLGKQNADKANGAMYRFRLLMAQRKFPEALALAQDLSAKMSEFAQSWVTLAQAQQANGHLDAAVQAYQRALDKQTDNADAIRGLIDCAYQQNRPEEAQRYIAQARRTFPTSPYFRELELRHTLEFGDPDQAVAQWEDAKKRNPDSRETWSNLARAYWRGLTTHRSQHDAAGSKKYEDALASLAADGVAKWPDDRVFYAFQADLAAARNDVAAGADAINRLAARPAWKGKPETSLMLADYYTRFGKLPEAEAAARQAVKDSAALANGDDSQALVKLAGIQAAAGHVDDALKTLDAKSDNPQVVRAKLNLLSSAKRWDSAEKLAISMLEKDPKATDVMNSLVGIYLETGQYDQALARVNQVLTTDPQNVGALYGRALANLRRPKPDLDAAIADLKVVRDDKASNNPDRDVQARYWLAEALLAKRDVDGSLRELDAAVRQAPGNKALRLRFAQICAAANPPRWVEAERVLRQGREIPELAADPELAVAEIRMWVSRQQADRGVDVAQKAIAQTNSNPEVIRAYLDAMLAAGSYQRLITETDKVVADQGDKTPWWVYTDRGVAKRRLDHKDEALAEFERALNSNDVKGHDDLTAVVINTLADEVGVDEALARVAPKAADGNVRWTLVQAYLYQQKHDTASAIETIEKAMGSMDKMTPDQRANVLRYAGSLYLAATPKPMAEKALEAFKRTLKETPDDVAVLNNVASILTDYLDTPRPQEALEYSQHAYDLMRKAGVVEPLILDTQGRVLTMLNKTAEGIVLLQEAADRTTIPDVHYHLAEAYMQQKAPAEAQKHLVKAQAAIEKAQKDKQPVDPKMIKRVDELMAQTKQMLGTKAQASGAQ